MRVYNHVPQNLIRVSVSRKNDKTEYITLCECTPEEAEVFIKKTISSNLNLFPDGYATRVDLRNAIGGKNGKSQSFKCYGISPKDIVELINKNIT